jgi:hypothetical protein
MDAIGGCYVKWSKPDSQRQRPHVFSHMWKTDPKDKHIHKNKCDHIWTYIEHVCNNGTTLWNSKERKEKENCSQQYCNTLHLCM